MTKVVFFRDSDQNIPGFECSGHSGYAQEGEDIVCAGVSALVFNAVNSIETLTDAHMLYEEDPETAQIRFSSEDYERSDVQLLLQSLRNGLQRIEASYGSQFIEVSFKEV